MFGHRFVVLTALVLMAGACAKPSSGGAPPPAPLTTGGNGGGNGGGSTGSGETQVGSGSAACPFSTDPAAYAIKAPETTKILDSIPDGSYVLTQVRTHRTSLTTPETDVFTNGAKIILKEPGRIGTSDTIQLVVQDSTTALTAGNLSFPLDFKMSKGKVSWGRFADYEPKLVVKPTVSIGAPVVKDQDQKILKENTGRHSFNVFARKKISGYQTVVKLSQADFGVIKGTIAIEADGVVRFVIEIPRGSSSTDVIESTYELTFKLESKAKAPDCGGNASAVKVLGS